jgi:hypothetical protein
MTLDPPQDASAASPQEQPRWHRLPSGGVIIGSCCCDNNVHSIGNWSLPEKLNALEADLKALRTENERLTTVPGDEHTPFERALWKIQELQAGNETLRAALQRIAHDEETSYFACADAPYCLGEPHNEGCPVVIARDALTPPETEKEQQG